MANLLAAIENSPAILVSIVFFIGWTSTLWGLPALKSFLKGVSKSQ